MENNFRKVIRLKDYDYSQSGAYFITICTKDKKSILSQIKYDTYKIELTSIGIVVENSIKNISKKYPNAFIDSYVIMPNHVHLIIFIVNGYDNISVSTIIQQFKGYTSKQVQNSIWQKSFYDHIIRNERDLFTKRKYIEENPLKWKSDGLYHE